MSLTFREDTHQYFLDGEELPSVTTIMKPMNDFSKVDPIWLESKARLGKFVHSAIEMWLNNELDENALDPALKPSLDAFTDWYSASSCLSEYRLHHPSLKYAGTVDLIIEDHIYDIKTRKFNMVKDAIQLVAYKQAAIKLGLVGVNAELWVLEIIDGVLTPHRIPAKAEKEAWGRFRKLLEKNQLDKEISQWKM